MIGIEALYKCQQDSELEYRYRDWKWLKFGESLSSSSKVYAATFFIVFEDGWEVRKRQTNLDKCMEEIRKINWMTYNDGMRQMETIITKYIKD